MIENGKNLNLKVFKKYITVNKNYLQKIYQDKGEIKVVEDKFFLNDKVVSLKELAEEIESFEDNKKQSEDFMDCRNTYKWKNYLHFLKKRKFKVSLEDYFFNKIKILNKETINKLLEPTEELSVIKLDSTWLTQEYINSIKNDTFLNKNILLFNQNPIFIEINNNNILQIFSILQNYENLMWKSERNDKLKEKVFEKEELLRSLINKNFKNKINRNENVSVYLKSLLRDSKKLLSNVISKY